MGCTDLQGLAFVTEAEEVFGESALGFVAGSALGNGVGLEAFRLEAGEDFAGGDVGVFLAAGGVGVFREDGRGDAAEVIGSDRAGAAGVACGAVGAAEAGNAGAGAAIEGDEVA